MHPSSSSRYPERIAVLVNSGGFHEVRDDRDVVAAFQRSFPFSGSFIDWSRLPFVAELAMSDRVSETVHLSNRPKTLLQQTILAFFEDFLRVSQLTEVDEIYILSDQQLPFTLRTDVRRLRPVLDEFLAIPQYTYIIPRGYHACFAIYMSSQVFMGCRNELPGISSQAGRQTPDP